MIHKKTIQMLIDNIDTVIELQEGIYKAIKIFDEQGTHRGYAFLVRYPDKYNQTIRVTFYSDLLPWNGHDINPGFRNTIIKKADPYYVTSGKQRKSKVEKFKVLNGYNKKGKLILRMIYRCDMESGEIIDYLAYQPILKYRMNQFDHDYCL